MLQSNFLQKQFEHVRQERIKREEALEALDIKLDEMYENGTLEKIVNNQDAHSILSTMFHNFVTIQDYDLFLKEIAVEDLQDEYGDILPFHVDYDSEIDALKECRSSEYHAYDICFNGTERLIFKV